MPSCKRKALSCSTLSWMATRPWCSLAYRGLDDRYRQEVLPRQIVGAVYSSRPDQRSFTSPVWVSRYTFGQSQVFIAFCIRTAGRGDLTPGSWLKPGTSRESNGSSTSIVRVMRLILG